MRAALCAISAYRLALSPMFVVFFGYSCRFTPTCSEYAQQAVINHGLWRGVSLSVKRLLRCRPGGGWGYDPVSVAASSSRQPEGKLLG
jgi:putative membrane protein insertion efficiency factor